MVHWYLVERYVVHHLNFHCSLGLSCIPESLVCGIQCGHCERLVNVMNLFRSNARRGVLIAGIREYISVHVYQYAGAPLDRLGLGNLGFIAKGEGTHPLCLLLGLYSTYRVVFDFSVRISV